MNILIAVASRHGGTDGIASALAEELRIEGDTCEVKRAEDVDTLNGYDAVIVGSAVYMGKWLPQARQFVERYHPGLATMPVWLFSSGPVGNSNAGADATVEKVLTSTKARGHRMFSGRLDRAELGLAEKIAVRVVHAPDGDFRDWDEIREWAHEIGRSLATSAPLAR